MQTTNPVLNSAPAYSFLKPGYFHLPLNALNSFSLFDLFEDALADLFCLKTFVHGTSPRNYYNIIWTGADPEKADREVTGMRAYRAFIGDKEREKSEAFHLTPDITEEADECPQPVVDGLHTVVKKIAPRAYATTATIGEQNYPKKIEEKQSWEGADYANLIKGFVLSIFSPTLKFRFAPETKVDLTYQNSSTCYSEKPIGAEHIGLYGTIVQGLQGNLSERIEKNFSQFLWGVAKLVAAVALTAIVTYGILYSSSIIFTIAEGILMYETAVCIGRIVVPALFSIQGEIEPLEEQQPGGSGADIHSNLPPEFRPNWNGSPQKPRPSTMATAPFSFVATVHDHRATFASEGTPPEGEADSPLPHPAYATLKRLSTAGDEGDDNSSMGSLSPLEGASAQDKAEFDADVDACVNTQQEPSAPESGLLGEIAATAGATSVASV